MRTDQSSQGPAVNYVIIIIILATATIKWGPSKQITGTMERIFWRAEDGDPCWHWTPLYRRSFLNPYNTQLIGAVMIISILRRLVGWWKPHYKLYCLTSWVIREFKIRDFMKLLGISPVRIETYLHCTVPRHTNIGKSSARLYSSQGLLILDIPE